MTVLLSPLLMPPLQYLVCKSIRVRVGAARKGPAPDHGHDFRPIDIRPISFSPMKNCNYCGNPLLLPQDPQAVRGAA